MRTKFVAGNWKMYTNAATARQLAQAVVAGVGTSPTKARVALCPPFLYLMLVADIVRGTPVALGGQNCYTEQEGAFTGEVSPAMLVDVGCRHVILGHSERRHKLGETDDFINRKVRAALTAGLDVILCIGETLQERQQNQMEAVLARQLDDSLAGITAAQMEKVVVAYEPVWAIGTGQNATPVQAQQAHQWIRRHVATRWNEKLASMLTIQYGGSVKPENAASLLGQPDVDGALVGGASLKADQFLAIVRAA
jgi:triosephosphate isomerase (TIM)